MNVLRVTQIPRFFTYLYFSPQNNSAQFRTELVYQKRSVFQCHSVSDKMAAILSKTIGNPNKPAITDHFKSELQNVRYSNVQYSSPQCRLGITFVRVYTFTLMQQIFLEN